MVGKKRSASVFVPAAPASPVPNLEEKHTEKAVEAIAAPTTLTAIPSEEAPPAEGKPVLTGRAHSLFFTPEDDSREFPDVCREVQGYIVANYSTLMTGESDSREQIKRYAAKYVQDKRIAVKGMTMDELIDAIYSEMAEYGFLTKYIFGSGIEEIDVNPLIVCEKGAFAADALIRRRSL